MQDVIGKAESLSFGDIKTVNLMYQCNGKNNHSKSLLLVKF